MPTFDVKCTLPPPGTTFVRPPDVRVLCTWAVMPLNVPTQYKSIPGRQTRMRTLRRTLNKLRWLAFNILGPEWPFMKAFNSRYNTKILEKRFDRFKELDGVVWTRSHTQLANVGGSVISFKPEVQEPAGQVDVEELAHPEACINDTCGVPIRPWRSTRVGDVSVPWKNHAPVGTSSGTQMLSTLQMLAWHVKLLIEATSRTKLTVGSSQHLASGSRTSEYFTAIGAITYALLFDRPKDVQTMFEVQAACYPTPKEMSRIANISPNIFSLFRSTVSLPNNSTHQNDASLEMVLSSSFAVITFGSLHFAAWGYEFPTRTERALWRASAFLTITVVPTIFATAIIFRQFNASITTTGSSAFVRFWILAPLFIAARLFILVEVVRSLAYQPPGSYKTTWAAYVPHVG
ncbi:hypothetical protein Q7P36_008565 [Cladosporium allicinum]